MKKTAPASVSSPVPSPAPSPAPSPDRVKKRVSLVFVIGIFIILLLDTLALSIYMRRTALNNTVQYEMTVVDTLSSHIDDMNSTAQSLLVQLFNNRNVQQITTYDNLGDVELLSLRSQLSDYYFQTPYMYSYYLINTRLERVCTRSSMYSFESFADQELLEMLDAPEQLRPFRSVVRHGVPTAESDVPTNYFTYFQFDAYKNSRPSGFIVINISEEWIQGKINDVCRNSELVFIFDQAGSVVLAGSENTPQNDEEIALIYSKLLQHDGSFAIKIAGVEYTGLHARANNGQWTIVRLVPSADIYRQPNRLTLTMVAISLLIFAACVTVYILSSNRVLSPVNALVQQVKQLEAQQARTYSLRQEMLSALIRRSSLKESDTELAELCRRYDMHIRTDRGCMLCLCRVDRYFAFCEQYDGRTRSSLQFAIANVARDLLQPVCQLEYIYTEPGSLLLILNDFRDGLDADPEQLRQVLRQVQKAVRDNLSFSFSCSLSDIGTFSDFRSQYAQVYDLIQQRFFAGPSCIVLPDDLPPSEPASPAAPVLPALQEISELLTSQSHAQCGERVLALLEGMKGAEAPQVMQVIRQVNAVIQEYSFAGAGFASDAPSRLAGRNLLREVENAETLEEACEGYRHFFSELAALSQERSESGGTYLQLIAEVKKSVAEQYADPNLSLQSLSENSPFSSVYLGRIFRRMEGCSVSSYINNVRMKQAAKLLTETHLSVNEIAQACGVENINYMYTLFKKHYGMTPGEYKRTHSSGGN